MENCLFDRYDEKISKELQHFLPDKIFDFHAHLFEKDDLDTLKVPILSELPQNGGIDTWNENTGLQVGLKRLKGGLFFGLPVLKKDEILGRIKRVNFFIIDQLCKARNTHKKGLLLISNAMDPAEVESMLNQDLIAGLKPYAGLNPSCPVFPDISDYLPEWACELAHQRGLVIMLHIQKSKALFDSDNIREIKRICADYPSMKLVLAHGGSGFNMYNTIKGIDRLAKIENLWFDTSAVCESMAIITLIRKAGGKRILWGTDYPVSIRKGRFVTLGNMFFTIQKNTIVQGSIPPGCDLLQLGLESLRAVIDSICECKLKDSEIEDIFYNNAVDLLSLIG